MTAAAVLREQFPDEDLGWMANKVAPIYRSLVEAGWPVVVCAGGGVLGRLEGILLQRHLDGTGWIMQWHGGTICVTASMLGNQPPGGDPIALRAWQPINIHNLTDSQVRVLRAIVGNTGSYAPRDLPASSFEAGVIDEDIASATGLAISTVQHLRAELIHKCLVIAKQGIFSHRESSTGARSQQWVVTKAGHAALCPPAPSLELLTAQLDRPAAAPD